MARSERVLTPHGRRNRTPAVIFVGTARPSTTVGVKRHCRAAFTAVGSSIGIDLRVLFLITRPVHERLTLARTFGWGFAFLAVSVGTAAARAQSPPSPRYADVYVAGEGGYQAYRIPSVIATPTGTLLAFAEARRTGAGDAGDIDLVVRRSHDGGDSWSPMQIVGDNGPNTFGNPCPVVDRNTGTIWLLTTQNRGTDREKDIIAGTSEASRTVWAMKSVDDGVTWSTPVEITASVKRPGWTWYATGPGIGIQTTLRPEPVSIDHTSFSAMMAAGPGGWAPARKRGRTRARSWS